jgi:hypothetical protein
MRTFAIAMLVVLAAACAKKEPEKKEDAPKVSAEDTAKEAKEAKEKAAKAKEVELAALVQQIKTKEDFEDSAQTEITEENLEAELTKLEQQLDVEAPEVPGASANAAASGPGSLLRPALPKPVKAPEAIKPAVPKAPVATP